MLKKSTADAYKISSKRVIQKALEATGNLISNKIAKKIMRVWKNSQSNSDTVTNKNDKVIPKGRYIYLEKRQEITDSLRLLTKNNKFDWW